MPLESAEYRWVCAHTRPGSGQVPEQSRRGTPGGAAPTAAILPSLTSTSALVTSAGSRLVTTVPPQSASALTGGAPTWARLPVPPASPASAGGGGTGGRTG